MVIVEHSIVVRRPADHVFATLINYEDRLRWQPELVDEKRVPEGEIRLGTRLYRVQRLLGGRIQAVGVVVTLEPQRRIVIQSLPNTLPFYEWGYHLSPTADGVRVGFHTQFDLRGLFLLPLLEPVVRFVAAKQLANKAFRLKSVMEAN
jgi:hypothetical protein